MNGYEKPDNINNRTHGQINMGNSIFTQNETPNFHAQVYYPGHAGLRNQEIAMQAPLTGHLQPTQQLICNPPYPSILSQNCYVHGNQIFTQIIQNHPYTQMPTNMMRPNLLNFNQPQISNVYHSPMEKMNQNPQSHFLMHPNIPIYHQPNQQIQHTIPHIQAQISPQMSAHIHPQMHQPQLSNQYSAPNRQYIPTNINEKQAKVSSALEIIHPDTKKSIDLKAFQNTKNNKIENSELKIESHEYHKFNTDQNKCSKDQYLNTNINKTDYPENHEPIHSDLHKVGVEIKENDGINIDKTDSLELVSIKSDFLKSQFDEDDDSRSNIAIIATTWLSQNTEDLETNDKGFLNQISENVQDKDISQNVDISLVQDIDINLSNGYLNKFIYTRDELIKIGKTPLSRQKPKGLPFKEEFTDPIILDHPINITGLEHIESIHSVNQRSSKVNKCSQGASVSWRNYSLKNSHGYPKYINLGNTENVLSKRDDGYITCKQRIAAGEELSETEELIRQIKGILNRIVPQNFDQCLDDLVSLKIGTHEGMTCLVNELFLKAVKEEAYSVTFAKICSYLASIKADVSDHEIVTFRSVLLQKCQAMFTTPLEEQLQNVRQEWLLKASNEKPKTKALMESDVDEQIKKAKDRYYGNIRFIGELYLKGVLITKIICFCIENLLTKENDADSLICLCKLLETCGAKLETENKGKEKLNESFKKLRQLSESMLIETRVRFRILDIMEMRQKQWCLRKVQQEQKIEPKTLEEIKTEKEFEESKDYYLSLNRKNINNWTPDRRPSLPSVSKSRQNFTPKQLSVTSCSYDPTTLGPQKRNWSAGSGAAMNPNIIDSEKNIRITRSKGKINSEHRLKENVYGLETPDVLINQTGEGCVTNYANCFLHTQSFSTCSYQSTNSSENSSRSSSHSRSTPQIILKEKLPDSKLAQSITLDFALLSPVEFFKEYSNSNELCFESWNSYSDKVEVVYQLLDSNFDTNCDNRISLSNLLSKLINEKLMKKGDLLKAFSKLIDSLEDLIIDVGRTIWDSLYDYFIPFLKSKEKDSIDLIDNIFDFEALNKFEERNALIIYSLPWSMINKIIKSNADYPEIFKLAVDTDCIEQLPICEQKLISILSKNLIRAIKIVTQIDMDFYLSWFIQRIEESSNCYSEEFFIILNWEEIFHQVQSHSVLSTQISKCFKQISSMSKRNEIFSTLRKISKKTDESCSGIFSILRCLLVTNTYDLQTLLKWELESHTVPFPSKLKCVLTKLKNRSAFISDDSFEYLFSFEESNNCFSNSTFDHNNCTNSD